ncbi:MAG: MarR family transcriptional regulator [Acidobacteria bacterium]|nr:MAG: MarR family transcriptional regulator [Acidobacteriota bacterium]PYR73944.1 MAG: MarR family transcriptional regulator [Acidobacteriota bacterium]
MRLDSACYHTYYFGVASELQAELKQHKPFRSLKEEALVSIVRTSAVLEHAFEAALKPHGITVTQYNVLRILRGSEPQGLCRSEIAERLVRQAPDVTRLLDRLEDAKLIARQRGGEDRRYVVTRITRAGLALLTDIERQIDAIHSEQIGHLDEPQLRKLISLLAAVRRRGVKES